LFENYLPVDKKFWQNKNITLASRNTLKRVMLGQGVLGPQIFKGLISFVARLAGSAIAIISCQLEGDKSVFHWVLIS